MDIKKILLAGGSVYLLSQLLSKEGDCPKATYNLQTNTKNRNAAIKTDWIQYGPLNLSDNKYWQRLGKFWGTSAQVAKQSRCANCIAFDISPRMLDCIKAGQPSERIEDADGYLGYCWMHKFKCHSARSCYTWAGGGPVSTDKKSYEWEQKTA